ncbi:MAG: hypothetical protein P4L99_15900 [Chthoniobacter sp.]|nr:hypothetical protein [Chthoniobacter sp.]
MKPELQTRIVWGWLRAGLGIAQMALSVAAVIVWFRIGLQPLTWILAGSGMAVAATSQFLYRGKKRPDDKP